MTTIFFSGSRKITRLNEDIRKRISNITEKQFHILVGDANGADKALQKYLADIGYANVVVFCSGKRCRNNMGAWAVRNIEVDSKLRGRDFYTQKDIKMAETANYGFVLWDGKSSGSINNVFELLKRDKKALVYFSPEKKFYNIYRLDDANNLLEKCDKDSFRAISRKIKLPSSVNQLQSKRQMALSF